MKHNQLYIYTTRQRNQLSTKTHTTQTCTRPNDEMNPNAVLYETSQILLTRDTGNARVK